MIHFYAMRDTDWLGPYQEVNVMVGATLPGSRRAATPPISSSPPTWA
jgi:acetoacetate decarboxylase